MVLRSDPSLTPHTQPGLAPAQARRPRQTAIRSTRNQITLTKSSALVLKPPLLARREADGLEDVYGPDWLLGTLLHIATLVRQLREHEVITRRPPRQPCVKCHDVCTTRRRRVRLAYFAPCGHLLCEACFAMWARTACLPCRCATCNVEGHALVREWPGVMWSMSDRCASSSRACWPMPPPARQVWKTVARAKTRTAAKTRVLTRYVRM